MTTQKKEYLTYDEVLTDMKVKISGHIDLVKGLQPRIEELFGDMYSDKQMKGFKNKVKKGIARVFREENKDLIDIYKNKGEGLGEDVLATGYIDKSFAIDTDVSEETRKHTGRKETMYNVLDVCGDYHTKDMLLYKDIYTRQREKKGSVYQDKTSGSQMFSREAVEELGLLKDLPSKEDMMYFRKICDSDEEFVQRILNRKEEDIFVGSISDKQIWIKNNYIRIFLSDGSSMTIYRFPENEGKFFEFHEKNDSLVACSVYLKEKKSIEEIQSIV